MSKVSGTYPSLSRGVNQQPFEARLDGQHGEQVNMWSDPVHGLTRRRGTILQYCYADNVFGPSYHQLTEAQKKEYREWRASFRTIPYTVDGKEFMLHYPSAPRPAWITSIFTGPDIGVKASLKFERSGSTEAYATVVPVEMGTYGDTEYTRTWNSCSLGFAGAAQIGRHILLYPNQTAAPNPAQTDAWAALDNGTVAMEVKQGIPNRSYSVRAQLDGVQYDYTYTTPSSSYSGTLDTSDIPFSDPEYQKKVNDRVNAYNDAVTKWITTAANQTRPQYIAQQLAGLMTANMTAVGALVNYNLVNPYIIVYISNERAANFVTTDGGDGSNFIVNERTVDSISKLTNYHVVGKIMRIKPDRGEQAFYMKAVSDNPYAFGRIRWEECPRTSVAGTFQAPWLILSHNNSSGKLGLAQGDPSGLLYLSTTILGYGSGNPARPDLLPQPNHRLVGDEDSSPTPAYYGKQVTWVGMFQDRLAFAAGGTLNFSEVGNYFNFWRTQTLTVPDKDPVEVYALGSEADTIRHSVIFDRSLLLFGDNQQYSIDGRNPLTPSTSTVIQSSAIEGTTDAPPVVGRDLVFFAKRRESSTEVFQMEVGDVSDTSRFTGLGLQLSDYLPGKPAQMLYVASPSTLFVRTSEAPFSIFVFKFIDQGNQRLMDSWSRFDYHPAFGIILGMFYHDDAIYLRVDREAWVDEDGHVWTGGRGDYGFEVLERQSLLPQVPGLPYLDSARKGHTLWTSGAYGTDWYSDEYPFLAAAFTRDRVDNIGPDPHSAPKNQYWLHGHAPAPNTLAKFNTVFADIPSGEAKRDTDYYVLGLPFESYVELTSPVRRDQNGQPIMQGRLTVNRLDVYYKDAGGFEATVTSRYGITEQYNNFDWSVTDTAYGKITALRFNGRLLGDSLNMVGVIPITSGNTPVFVGREAKDYVCKIGARSWMPLSITRITWTGQWFMNHRFV